jgi:crossover junction endodeoxyribonuclease RusA
MGMDIELPWPPKELTPNAKRRKHWTAYRKPAADYRQDCAWLCRAWLLNNKLGLRARELRVAGITFYPPDRRRRDDDGMIGAFKAGRDGVADALGVDDHTFRPTYSFAEPIRGGKVVVSVLP